jgi:outer membrane protein assembly factor BamB
MKSKSLILFTLLTVAAVTAAVHAEDWPRWRGPRGDGTWQAPPIAEKWPVGGLKQIWKHPIGGGYGGISIADGRAIVMDRVKEPREVERVLAYDLATGKPLWKHEYPVAYEKLDYGNGPRAAPTIVGDEVYTLGAVGHVCRLEASTGKLIWTVDTVKDSGAKISEWGFAGSPLIWNDTVIVHVGAQPGGCYLALDRATGRERWRSGDDPAGYSTPIVIDAPGGKQLVGWTPEHIVGMNPDDGKLEWKIPYKVTYGVSIADPIYHDGIVFVAGYWEGSKAIRLGPNRTDAELAWQNKDLLRGVMSQPLYRDGRVFLLDKIFGITCFELKTGNVLWDDDNTLTPRNRNPQASLVWLGDTDRVISLNAEGELVTGRFTPTGFTEHARAKIIGPTWAHPGYSGRYVVARNDEEIVCVELPAP